MERESAREFGRGQRQTADEFERLMWQLLRNRQRCNKKFRRQHTLGVYTADFYCVEERLVVEIDGDSHLSEEAKRYDAARDRWMNRQGIRVLRFTCTEVDKYPQLVLAKIDAELTNPKPQTPHPPAPSPREFGENLIS
jgi:very-short-patch-repair endonuclease